MLLIYAGIAATAIYFILHGKAKEVQWSFLALLGVTFIDALGSISNQKETFLVLLQLLCLTTPMVVLLGYAAEKRQEIGVLVGTLIASVAIMVTASERLPAILNPVKNSTLLAVIVFGVFIVLCIKYLKGRDAAHKRVLSLLNWDSFKFGGVAVTFLALVLVDQWFIGEGDITRIPEEGIRRDLLIYAVGVGLIAFISKGVMEQAVGKVQSQGPDPRGEDERNKRLYTHRVGGNDVLENGLLREDALEAIGLPQEEVDVLKDEQPAADAYREYGKRRQLDLMEKAIDDGERPAKLDDSWDQAVLNGIAGVDDGLFDEFELTVEDAWNIQGPSPQEVDQALGQLFGYEETILTPDGREFYKPEVRKAGLSVRKLRWLGINPEVFNEYVARRIKKKLREAQIDPEQPDPVSMNGKPSFSVPVLIQMGINPDRLRDHYNVKADEIV